MDKRTSLPKRNVECYSEIPKYFLLGPHIHTETDTNRCSRYNTGTTDVNYQNNLNNHKEDNYNPKVDNPTHKLDPEKLETDPTNAYNQPTNNRVKNITTI
jgi:hypothetical protein